MKTSKKSAFIFDQNELHDAAVIDGAGQFTIQLGLVNLQGYMGANSVSIVIAGIFLAMIPVFIIYMIGQRYLVEGIVHSGLKG